MQLRHLAYLAAVVDAGTISGAAADVHVTQPSLSRQLRQLEAELGVGLFDRSPGRVVLNRTGQALMPQIRRVLAESRALQENAAFHAAGRVDRWRIVAPTVTLTDIVSPFVATMDVTDPIIDVRSGDGLTTQEMLDAGADLAIGAQRPQTSYSFKPLTRWPVWAYVTQADAWSSRNAVTLDELVSRPLIGVPGTFAARAAVDSALVTAGLSYSSFVEAVNGTIAQALAATGRGAAIVTDDPRFDLVPVGVEVGGALLQISLYAGWDPRGVAATMVESLVDRMVPWVRARQTARRPEVGERTSSDPIGRGP